MNRILLFAAILNLITALIHTIAGELVLISAYHTVDFQVEYKAILHACWHMVTVALFATTIVLFMASRKKDDARYRFATGLIGWLYIFFTVAFIIVSIAYGKILFQPALLGAIGISAIIGSRLRKQSTHKRNI